MSLVNGHETNLLNLIFSNTDWANIGDAAGLQASTAPGSLWISLHTSDPGEAGSDAAEVSGNGYARQSIARSGAGWTVSGSNASNAAAITFPTATGSWGTVSHVGIHYDNAASSMVFYAALGTSKAITTDDVFEIAIGDLDIDLD